MKECFFKDLHALDHKTNDDAPELRFMRHICEGGNDIEAYFHDKTSSKRDVMVYTPYDRFEGKDGIGRFAEGFLKMAGATGAEIHPVVQTLASGRSVTEAEVWFDRGEEEPYVVPMSFFCDLGHDGKMEGLRVYYFFQWIEGTTAYYEPVFRPAYNEPADPNNLSGIIKHYYEQLHNFYKDDQLENILEMFSDEPRIGGYRPQSVTPRTVYTKEKLRDKYSKIVENIPKYQYIRFEAVTDDGRNCLVEWTSVMTRAGQERGYMSQAGMVAYERDTNGKICSVRICDNFRYEDEVDWGMVKPENNFVEK